jgi:hypothetical protein
LSTSYEANIRFQNLNYRLVNTEKLESAILAALAGGVIDIAAPDAISCSKTAPTAVIFHTDEDSALMITARSTDIAMYAMQYYCHGDITGSRGCPEEYTAKVVTISEEDAEEQVNASSDDTMAMSNSTVMGAIVVVAVLVMLVAILAWKSRTSTIEAAQATRELRKMNSITPMGFNNSGFVNTSAHSGMGPMDSSMMDFNNSYNQFVAQGSRSVGIPTPARVNAWSPDQKLSQSLGPQGPMASPPVYKEALRRGPGMPVPKIDSALLIHGASRRPSMTTAQILQGVSNGASDTSGFLNASQLSNHMMNAPQLASHTNEVGSPASTNTDTIAPAGRRTMFVEHPPMPPPINVPVGDFSFAV